MSNMKRTIRLDRIDTRSKKVRYTGLTPLERRFIKLEELQDNLSKGIGMFWKYHAKYLPSGAADQDRTDWTLFWSLQNDYDRVSRQIGRLTKKYQIDTAKQNEIRQKHLGHNTLKLYGGSF